VVGMNQWLWFIQLVNALLLCGKPDRAGFWVTQCHAEGPACCECRATATLVLPQHLPKLTVRPYQDAAGL
jgi:hypothetical protein